jgi:hypothetical protein
MFQPSASFKTNLDALPSIDGVARIDLVASDGTVVDSIENQPGKKGSLAVYQHLQQTYGALNAEAAAHGLAVFGEHTADAKARPGAHPNIDRLFEIMEGAAPLQIVIVAA